MNNKNFLSDTFPRLVRRLGLIGNVGLFSQNHQLPDDLERFFRHGVREVCLGLKGAAEPGEEPGRLALLYSLEERCFSPLQSGEVSGEGSQNKNPFGLFHRTDRGNSRSVT